MTIPCPICRKPVNRTDSEFPFCSERCRTIDLGNWASEKYVISSPADPREIHGNNPFEQHDED
jgi:hypothetical protein